MPTAQPPKSSLRFSGGVFTLSILRLTELSSEGLARELAAQGSALQLLQGAPLVLDLGEYPASAAIPFAELLAVLRAQGCFPVGVRNATATQAAAAAEHGLPQLRGREEAEAAPAPKPASASAPRPAGELLCQGVRSGQRHYGHGGDLVCLGAVNAGAEVLADGHIHVYGPLRGRALAGVQGDETARIFCQRLEAELVAIAGVYCNLDSAHPLWGKAAEVSLEGETLHIIPLAK